MSPAQMHHDDTRTRILDVALELIADHGFASTSTRELSERLGFTKAALYYHFRTKDDLLAALVAPVLGDIAALVAERTTRESPAARREVLASYVALVAAHEEVIRVLSQDPSVRHTPATVAAAPLYERLAQLLSGQDAPDATARARVNAALGGVRAAILNAAPDDDKTIVSAAALAAACGALGIKSIPQSLTTAAKT
jgi:AcrR family transcriptional regulator